ncbi:IclR family transcriptional regulator [Rhodococcus sp. T7]|uniref:IclR family transcriptional regulator n=1 Tax=Rhodococcus sp. T7 TaxID=627444 RepID=UPI0013C54F4A|nr:helix-turn-helix domain-containing protein [Rhodococcus sp. T7]KAF0960267.1 hypothetical protein MLGJGCBP_06659 [Rhodococcus sp. T7]
MRPLIGPVVGHTHDRECDALHARMCPISRQSVALCKHMTRRSPQTERLVEVVDFLATTPQRAVNLTDIARQLDVDKATCLPMLAELTRVGWLVKNPDNKSYRLGPRLVALGHAATEALDVVSLAGPLLTDLADELRCACALIIRSSNELAVATIAQPKGERCSTLGLRPGDRIAFRPPLSGILMAWENRYAIERWIDRAPTATPEERQYYRETLARIRDRRYSVEQFEPTPQSMTELVEDRTSATFGSRRMELLVRGSNLSAESLVSDIAPEATYYPVSINAAVFDGNLHAQSAVCALDTGKASGAEVDLIARRVVDVAAAISDRAAGVDN